MLRADAASDALGMRILADVTFLKSTREGDLLTATADRRIRAGRTGLYDVTVTDQAGDVVAEFRGRSIATDRPAPFDATPG